MRRWALWLELALLCTACGSLPQTHFYRLALDDVKLAAEPMAGVLAVAPLEADATYTDDRIVYRTSPYALDYYNYHRWAAPPAVHVTDCLRDAYASSGLFRRVVSVPAPADGELRGRLTAFDEVDASESTWRARLELHLELLAADDGQRLWARQFVETEPIRQRDPEGVAAALSAALERVVRLSAADIARALAKRPEAGPSLPEAPRD